MKYYVEGDDGHLYEDHRLRTLFDEIQDSIVQNEKELFKAIDAKNKDMLFSRKRVKEFLGKESFDEIIVLGHSIGDADMPVFKSINTDAKLTCYFYEQSSVDDINKIKKNLESLSLAYQLIPNGDLYK